MKNFSELQSPEANGGDTYNTLVRGTRQPVPNTLDSRSAARAKVLVTCLLLSTSTQPGQGTGWVWV